MHVSSLKSLEMSACFSIASLWEMSIKNSLGKLKLPLPFTKLVTEQVYGNAIELLHIAPEHLDVLRTLPFYCKDPFDRLILAQSLSEDIPILSRENALMTMRYGAFGIEKRSEGGLTNCCT